MTEYEAEVAAGFPSVISMFCICGNRVGGDLFWKCTKKPCPRPRESVERVLETVLGDTQCSQIF